MPHHEEEREGDDGGADLSQLLNDLRDGRTRAQLAVSRGRKPDTRFIRGPVSLEELRAFDAPGWAEWLRQGIAVWVSTTDPAVRSSAFPPLAMSGVESGPIYLGQRLRGLGFETQGQISRGMHLCIAGQTALGDTAHAGFAFMLATEIDCDRFEGALRTFLARDVYANEADLRRLSAAIVQAIIYRTTPATAEQLARLMLERGVLLGGAAADLVAYLAAPEARRLAPLLDALIPNIGAISADTPSARYFVNRCIMRMGFEAFVLEVYGMSANSPAGGFLRAALERHRVNVTQLPNDLSRVSDRYEAGSVELVLREEDAFAAFKANVLASGVISLDEYRGRKK